MFPRLPPEPSPDACSKNERVVWDGPPAWACWYPQMGGYAGRAVIVPGVDTGDPGEPSSGCDVFVWHDGEFPFGEEYQPILLHHCSGKQFVRFGELIERLCAEVSQRKDGEFGG